MSIFTGKINHDVEKRLLEAISVEESWGLIQHFNDNELVRESGSKDEQRGFDYIEERLKSIGVPYRRYAPEVHLSVPQKATLELGKTGQSFKAKTPGYSGSTGPDGVTGELVFVGGAHAEDIDDLFDSGLKTVDVEGKIAICKGFGMPSKVTELERAGAIAQVFINPGERVHDGICTPIWGTPTLEDLDTVPITPVVSINNPDGIHLLELCSQGSVKVTIHTELDKGWKQVPLLEATISGTSHAQEFVLVHGHVDSWNIGIGDNAVGNATLLELAKVFHQHRSELRRTVKIAWWPGHSTGRYAGSTWYADHFARDLDRYCVAQVNIDSPGCRWATAYENVSVMPEAVELCSQAICDATGQEATFARPVRAGDYSFNNIGISSFYMLLSSIPTDERKRLNLYAVGGCGSNIEWHTEADRLEIADKDNLLRDLRVYATTLIRVLNSVIYPFDYRQTLTAMRRAFEAYQKDAAEAKIAANFALIEEELSLFDTALAIFYKEIQDNSSPLAEEKANMTLMRLARQLVSVDYTVSPRFYHDAAVPRPSLPALAFLKEVKDLDTNKKKFAQVQVIRAINHIAGALRQARELLE